MQTYPVQGDDAERLNAIFAVANLPRVSGTIHEFHEILRCLGERDIEGLLKVAAKMTGALDHRPEVDPEPQTTFEVGDVLQFRRASQLVRYVGLRFRGGDVTLTIVPVRPDATAVEVDVQTD